MERSKLAKFGNLLILGVPIQFIFLFLISNLFLKPFQIPGPFSISWSFFNFSTKVVLPTFIYRIAVLWLRGAVIAPMTGF